jgi:hypothetical protein
LTVPGAISELQPIMNQPVGFHVNGTFTERKLGRI